MLSIHFECGPVFLENKTGMVLWSSSIRFQEKTYDIIQTIGEGLFDPIANGLLHLEQWRGYTAGYEITDGQLYLNLLDLFAADGIRTIPIAIHDRQPVANGFSDFSYEGLRLPIASTGTLVIAFGFKISNQAGSIKTYAEKVKLLFDVGKLHESEDIQSPGYFRGPEVLIKTLRYSGIRKSAI